MTLRWHPACDPVVLAVGACALISGAALLAENIRAGLGVPVALLLAGAALLGLFGWDLAWALMRAGLTQALGRSEEPERPVLPQMPVRIRGRRGG